MGDTITLSESNATEHNESALEQRIALFKRNK